MNPANKNCARNGLGLLLVLGVVAAASAQATPPRFPQPAAFNAPAAPASAKQHAAMVRIAGGTYRIGAPGEEHPVELKTFRIDRTEVTNAQFAEFLNALPVKPSGAARGGQVGAANFAAAD